MHTHPFSRFAWTAVLTAGGVLALGSAPAGAAVLIDEDFSDGQLGPTPAETAWENASGHEFGAGSSFGGARNLAFTYDHDNDVSTDEVSVPGGYEVNGFSPNPTPPNQVLTVTVTMPVLLDDSLASSLTFWAAAREGATTGTSVSIRNATDGVIILEPTMPAFNEFTTGDGRQRWQFNQFTFAQLDSYAGDTFEVIFNGGGTNGASGLVLTDITFETDVVPEPASLALVGLGGVMLLARRRH